jgi:hypothetical protein
MKNSRHIASKIAGFMFLFILTDVIANWILFSKFIVVDNAIATANNIVSNQILFRIAIANEIILAISATILAVALFVILKPIDKNLSLIALIWKLIEGILMAGIALLNFIALQFLTGINQESLNFGYLINIHDVIYSIPMVFLGLNLTLFSYLFYKSGYIPKILSGLGVISYTLVFIFAFINILIPDVQMMILTVPSIIFELVIGLWLLIKGIKINGTP